MISAAYFYWFEATQSTHKVQQLGEFSEAEIAARQTPAPRRSVTKRVASSLLTLVHQPYDLPKAPAQA